MLITVALIYCQHRRWNWCGNSGYDQTIVELNDALIYYSRGNTVGQACSIEMVITRGLSSLGNCYHTLCSPYSILSAQITFNFKKNKKSWQIDLVHVRVDLMRVDLVTPSHVIVNDCFFSFSCPFSHTEI